MGVEELAVGMEAEQVEVKEAVMVVEMVEDLVVAILRYTQMQ